MQDRIRLFQNPLLERLTHAQPGTVAVLWGAVIGALAGWSLADARFTWGGGLAAMATGAACWTLFEYGLHRFVFHWSPSHPALKRMVYLWHGCHHADPQDPTRAVMPPMASIPLALALWGLTWSLAPQPWAGAGFAGFLCGYLHYDLTHWACHQVKPRSRWGRMLKRHHMVHHYSAAPCNYGVGTPLWDVVFRSILRRS